MSGATRGQKVRLGIFLGVAGAILGGTLFGMVGLAAIEKRDEYPVRFEGSVAGLSPGSPVRYNGIDVGRVDSVRIDPNKPSGVLVTISLAEGTPLRDDTVAVLNLQGITGLKFIELQGGREDASNIEPGTEVPSSRSTVDLLTDKAQSIALKLEDVLDNLARMTSGDNAKSITGILGSVDTIASSVARILEGNEDGVETLLTDARAVVTDVSAFITTAKATLSSVDGAIGRASDWVNPADVTDTFGRLQSTLGRVELTLSGVDDAVKNVRNRLSASEAGAAITAFTGLASSSTDLVKRADSTLLRAREDLFRVLDAVTEGAESFAELANLLRDDPASLLRGKGRDREVPE